MEERNRQTKGERETKKRKGMKERKNEKERGGRKKERRIGVDHVKVGIR